MTDPVLAARAAVGNARKKGDAAAETDARRALAEAKLERAVAEALASAPAPSQEQRERLAHLLLTGGAK